MQYYFKINDKHIPTLLAIAFITNTLKVLFDTLHYISYISWLSIVLLMLPHYRKIRKSTISFYIVFIYLLFLIIRGVLFSNYIPYLLFDISIYSSIVFLTYFKYNYNNFYSLIPILFAKLLILSVCFVLIIVVFYSDFSNLATRSLTGESNSLVDDSWIIGPLIIAPFIVPFIGLMKTYLKFIVLFANLLLMLFGILTATRSYIIITIIAFLSLIRFNKFSITKLFFFGFGGLIIFLFFFNSDYYKNSILSDQINFVENRFDMEGDISNGRSSEVEGLFSEFSFSEILFGRGAGAEQKFGFWKDIRGSKEHGINFTHFGFLNLILKGGVLLLLLIYGMVIYSLITFIKYGEIRYFFVLLIYLIAELSHTLFINYFAVLFLWLSISLSIQLRLKTTTNKIVLE